MNLTFKGFLRGYVRELTGLETDNLRKLLTATVEEAPAAAETLMAFAAVQGKARYLTSLAQGTILKEGYAEFARSTAGCDERGIAKYLAGEDSPDRYQKVWLAYRAKKEAVNADRRVIGLMREKTLESVGRSGTTVYSLCKALDLNIGNIYAYLNKGDVRKVSRETARRIMIAANAAEAHKRQHTRLRA